MDTLTRQDAEKIFEQTKEYLFYNTRPDSHPVAYLLGGQGACGKSNLTRRIEQDNICGYFLRINGDEYRQLHPDFGRVSADPLTFSSETQVLSSVFTEGLIREGVRRGVNLIIEGTMRRPQTVLRTARFLKEHGYTVKSAAIAASPELTRIGIYDRYARQLAVTGSGRLADVASHDAAAVAVPSTLQALHDSGLVDETRVYSLHAGGHISTMFRGEHADYASLFAAERGRQLCDGELREDFLMRAGQAEAVLPEEVRPALRKAVAALRRAAAPPQAKTRAKKTESLPAKGPALR